jgi:hypothetical protein
MRRRSLIGTAARTAVVVGTATAVSGAVAGAQQQKAAAAQQQAQNEAAQQQAQIDAAAQQAVAEQLAAQAPSEAAPAAAAAAPAITDEMIAQLQKLGELHASGVLSDEEFASLKAKLING